MEKVWRELKLSHRLDHKLLNNLWVPNLSSIIFFFYRRPSLISFVSCLRLWILPGCRKIRTKEITTVNKSKGRIRSQWKLEIKNVHCALRVKKREWPSYERFCYCFWLVKRVARDQWTNHKAKQRKANALWEFYVHPIKNWSQEFLSLEDWK